MDQEPGPHWITFSSATENRPILPKSPLPAVARNDMHIIGSVSPTGAPETIIDSRLITQCCGVPAISVVASGFSVSWMKFVQVQPSNRAVRIYAGAISGEAPAPQVISKVRIENCVFDNKRIATTSYAITLGMDHAAVNAIVSNVLIAKNQFLHFQGDGTTVHLQAGGEHGTIKNVTIQDNFFSKCTFSIELVNVLGSRNRIMGTKIWGNTFIAGLDSAVNLGNEGRAGHPPATGNSTSGTSIIGNRITSQSHWAILFNGGHSDDGGIARSNSILRTNISNNIIESSPQDSGGILLLGGDTGGESNRVRDVSIYNNTMVRIKNIAIVTASNPGGLANKVEGVRIANTIFWQNYGDLYTDLAPGSVAVSNSITSQAGFTGKNGNFASDPKFVALSARNYHLRSDSPAINRGATNGSPAIDFDCTVRTVPPDIGAYEFQNTSVTQLRIDFQGAGRGTVQVSPTARSCALSGGLVFPAGTVAVLTPKPASGSEFSGWSGDSDCRDGRVTMTKSKVCIAVFN